MRGYTIADGLVGDNEIGHVYQDSRGYLWISASSGLSRFDGRRFVNYFAGRESVAQVLEDSRGELWVAVGGALLRLDPDGGAGDAAFVPVLQGPVQAIHEDGGGRLWVGGEDRLARVARAADGSWRRVDDERLEFPHATYAGREIRAIDHSEDGSIWVATNWGLVRRLPGGERRTYLLGPGESNERLFALAVDRRGLVWIGHGSHLLVLRPGAPEDENGGGAVSGLLERARRETPPPDDSGRVRLPQRPGEVYHYGEAHGVLGTTWFGAIAEREDGGMLIGTTFGLTVFDGERFTSHGPADGIGEHVTAVAEDRDGNLWIGTGHSGLFRWSARGFESFRRDDGLASDSVAALGEDRRGELVVLTRYRSPLSPAAELALQRWSGGRFATLRLAWPELRNLGWGWGSLFAQDGRGDWWVGTGEGLLRLPGARRLDRRTGLGGNEVFRLFRDSDGALWVATFPEPSTLTRLDPATGRTRVFTPVDGWPDVTPTAFAETSDGARWFGLYGGGLVRYRDGAFTRLGAADGVPPGMVGAILPEADGALWVAADGGGLAHLRVAPGDRVEAEVWSVERGLTSNRVLSLVRDDDGLLFVGTDRGVDRLDPRTGRVESFGTQDGLAGTFVNTALRTRGGELWFGTRTGLSRFRPGPARAASVPTVLVTDLLVDGAPAPVPALGAATVAAPRLRAGRKRVRIGYSAIGFTAGERLRFQYRMEPLDAEWSPATAGLSADYASLPAGSYRFVVRALAGGVVPVGQPATVHLAIPAPIWQRGWFQALIVLLAGAAVYAAYRVRLSRLLALERQRTRIAMDLHDEVGSGLGSIGILADLAGDETDDGARRGLVHQIGDTASELGTSLGDIVGALRPGGAHLEALARQLAERGRRLFPGGGTTFGTSFPDAWPRVELSPPVRRNVYRIGLEALHNAARHSGARAVSLEIAREGRRWRLSVTDDGKGLAAHSEGSPEAGGRLGLESMRHRAEEIGAELSVTAAPNGGTEVTVRFDTRARGRGARLI